MNFYSNQDLADIVGEFDVCQAVLYLYRVRFDDKTPDMLFNAEPHLRAGKPHDLIDSILANQMVNHWADYNVPPVPKDAK